MLEKTIPLENVEGRIDHMGADVARHRLILAALGNNSVEVVDLDGGKVMRSLPGFAEPQGIAYAPEFDKLFVANGRDGTCRVLDGQSFKTLSVVEIGDDADNVRYDGRAGKIYVGYGNGALGVVDAKTGAKVGHIEVSAHPESFRLAASGGQIFVNVPKSDHIAVANREKRSVAETWPLTDARSNFAMDLDDANQRVFVGCRNPPTVLAYDSSTGRAVAAITISGDADDLFYDRDQKLIYVSCGAGVVEVIRQDDADHYTKLGPIPTAAGARTSLFIPELKLFCLAVPHRGIQPSEIRVYKSR